jgi:hypothetical protein
MAGGGWILALLTFCETAHGQTRPNCAPRDMVVVRLAERYGETRHAMGLGANNTVFELFASEETGTWTITTTTVNGLACLVASGEGFESIPPANREDEGA